jgi:hypothetical protein
VKLAKISSWQCITEWVEAAEAANPGRHLADAAHELGAGVDVHAGALVRHALTLTLTAGGGGAGHGDAPHPLAGLREADALRVGRAPASCGGGRGRWRAEDVEEAGAGHGDAAADAAAAPKAIVLTRGYEAPSDKKGGKASFFGPR